MGGTQYPHPQHSQRQAVGLISNLSRFSQYGKSIKMTKCEAAGPLPMRMDKWYEVTFWNSSECETDGVDRGGATEPSSEVEGSDAADVNIETPTLVKPEEHTDINTSDSASKVKESFEDVKLENPADIERDRDSSVHLQHPRRKNVDASKKREAAAESSAPLASSKRKSSKRKDAKAPKKKQIALSFEEDWTLY